MKRLNKEHLTVSHLLRRLFAMALLMVVLCTAISFPSQAKTGRKTGAAGLAAASAAAITNLVNAQVLTPTPTGYAPCDEAINNILAQIITPGMTTDQKLRACYDFLINTCSYGYNDGGFFAHDDYAYALETTGIPSKGPYVAWTTLAYQKGVCDNYACAFAAMARAIGVNSYVYNGQRFRADGGLYANHAWPVINLNGTEYVCDVTVEDSISKGKTIRYSQYMKSKDALLPKYTKYWVNYNYFIPFNMTLTNGVTSDEFDPVYYAEKYPDVVSAVGMNADALYQHYMTTGKAEGRYPTYDAEMNALYAYLETLTDEEFLAWEAANPGVLN